MLGGTFSFDLLLSWFSAFWRFFGGLGAMLNAPLKFFLKFNEPIYINVFDPFLNEYFTINPPVLSGGIIADLAGDILEGIINIFGFGDTPLFVFLIGNTIVFWVMYMLIKGFTHLI